MPTIHVLSQFELVDIHTLIPTEGNPQIHEIERYKRSIREYGFVSPIIVNSDNQVIGGHGGIKAVLEMIADGYELPGSLISVVRGNYTDQQAKLLLLALNKTQGRPDTDQLITFIESLELDTLAELEKASFEPIEIEDLEELIQDVERSISEIGDYEPPNLERSLDTIEDEPRHECPQCGHRW